MTKTSQQIGKDFERMVEGVFDSLQRYHGFRYHKFVDSHAAGNLVASQPSDYLVALGSQMAFVEAKASAVETKLQKAMIRPAQRGAALMYGQMLGVPYYILVYSEVTQKVILYDGAEVMRGSRVNHKNSVLSECLAHQMGEMLIKEWNLEPYNLMLQHFRKEWE